MDNDQELFHFFEVGEEDIFGLGTYEDAQRYQDYLTRDRSHVLYCFIPSDHDYGFERNLRAELIDVGVIEGDD